MRFALAILLAFAACTVARAQFQPVLQHTMRTEADAFSSDWQVVGSLSGLTTNAIFTNQVDSNLYHTIDVANNSTSPTNIVWTVDHSIDATNWVIGSTNTTANAVVGEVTLTQKIGFIRIRVTETNAVGLILYLGGR